MNVLIATSFPYRHDWYRQRLGRGFTLEFAGGGVECLERLRAGLPDVLILEASLLWGGAEGVLALRDADGDLRRVSVILVALGTRADELYRLSRYTVNDFFTQAPSDSRLAYRVRMLMQDRQEVVV